MDELDAQPAINAYPQVCHPSSHVSHNNSVPSVHPQASHSSSQVPLLVPDILNASAPLLNKSAGPPSLNDSESPLLLNAPPLNESAPLLNESAPPLVDGISGASDQSSTKHAVLDILSQAFALSPGKYKCPKPNCIKSYKHQGNLKLHTMKSDGCQIIPDKIIEQIQAKFFSEGQMNQEGEQLSAGTLQKIKNEAESMMLPYACQFEGCETRYLSHSGLSTYSTFG